MGKGCEYTACKRRNTNAKAQNKQQQEQKTLASFIIKEMQYKVIRPYILSIK